MTVLVSTEGDHSMCCGMIHICQNVCLLAYWNDGGGLQCAFGIELCLWPEISCTSRSRNASAPLPSSSAQCAVCAVSRHVTYRSQRDLKSLLESAGTGLASPRVLQFSF